jgi:hypothetical protein
MIRMSADWRQLRFDYLLFLLNAFKKNSRTTAWLAGEAGHFAYYKGSVDELPLDQ